MINDDFFKKCHNINQKSKDLEKIISKLYNNNKEILNIQNNNEHIVKESVKNNLLIENINKEQLVDNYFSDFFSIMDPIK